MKTILYWFCVLTLMAALAPRALAQDTATQQQLDQLSQEIQSTQEMLTQQGKQISDLESKIEALQDKANQPGGNDYASNDDLKKLAEQVQEIDKKRQDDNEKILKALEKLGKGVGGGADLHQTDVTPNTTQTDNNPPANTGAGTGTATGGPQNGYYYTVQSGNTLSAIARAYRSQGVKVTVKQILDANPGLTANNLVVGKKIFIPAPQ